MQLNVTPSCQVQIVLENLLRVGSVCYGVVFINLNSLARGFASAAAVAAPSSRMAAGICLTASAQKSARPHWARGHDMPGALASGGDGGDRVGSVSRFDDLDLATWEPVGEQGG